MVPLGLALLPFLFQAGSAAPGKPAIVVRVLPDPVYADRVGGLLRLSCDFELTNRSAKAYEIGTIMAKAFDAAGTLIAWNKVDSNGARPSIEVLGRRRVEPNGQLTVFNPFLFDTAAAVDHLTYEFRLRGDGEEKQTVTTEVRPATFRQRTRLIVPVPGVRLWAYDGPGFLSHHRRLDLLEPLNRDVLKIRGNGQRYAIDLVVLDGEGAAWHGDLEDQKNWVGFGTPIVAPAAGTIVAIEGSLPDDIPYDEKRLRQNPMLMIGNHLVIDHANGEFSVLVHFRKGSLRVEKGARVAQGQVLGEMGHSGMGSGLVHLHYELQTSASLFDAEGLPAQFEGFRRIGSSKRESGEIEAGWIIETPR